jgi:hypothetical protein
LLSAGFSSPSLDTYVITTVTDTWVEFVSGSNLPLEDGILPTAAGINIYNAAKSFVRVEVDQSAFVRLNGSAGNEIQLTPRVVGDLDGRAYFEMWGTVWSLVVVNRSATTSMTVQVISASEAV